MKTDLAARLAKLPDLSVEAQFQLRRCAYSDPKPMAVIDGKRDVETLKAWGLVAYDTADSVVITALGRAYVAAIP